MEQGQKRSQIRDAQTPKARYECEKSRRVNEFWENTKNKDEYSTSAFTTFSEKPASLAHPGPPKPLVDEGFFFLTSTAPAF